MCYEIQNGLYEFQLSKFGWLKLGKAIVEHWMQKNRYLIDIRRHLIDKIARFSFYVFTLRQEVNLK